MCIDVTVPVVVFPILHLHGATDPDRVLLPVMLSATYIKYSITIWNYNNTILFDIDLVRVPQRDFKSGHPECESRVRGLRTQHLALRKLKVDNRTDTAAVTRR